MRENHADRNACATLVHAGALMNLLGQLVSTPIQPNRLDPLLRAALARPIRDCKLAKNRRVSAAHLVHYHVLAAKQNVCKSRKDPCILVFVKAESKRRSRPSLIFVPNPRLMRRIHGLGSTRARACRGRRPADRFFQVIYDSSIQEQCVP